MKPNKFYVLIAFGMLFVACRQENSLKEYLVNTWQTTYLKIEMPTINRTDSLEVYEDKFEGNPELVAQSKYNKDGTFSAWFVNQEGKHVSPSKGKWNVVGDSLFVDFFYNGKDVKASYHITKTAEGFIGVSKYDWDEDGDSDDTLTMKTKSIKIN
ncbi:hypothetical protein [Polaribacter aquimarinus]|nr:hypothetical protein [Polaribacter aquimarinus]